MKNRNDQHKPNGVKLLSQEELERQAYCLHVSGYTLLRNQIPENDLEKYRKICQNALKVAGEREGASNLYWANRCVYCWGDEVLEVLEHENVHNLASLVMGSYKLWDLTTSACLPQPEGFQFPPAEWHHDFGWVDSSVRPEHLWFFVCLVDVNARNGGTWILPGSLRMSPVYDTRKWYEDDPEKYPSAIQVQAKAGDIYVLDPTALHSPGINYTKEPRLTLGVGLVREDLPSALDHWKMIGPALQERVTERVAKLLKSDETEGRTDFVPPEDWPVSL